MPHSHHSHSGQFCPGHARNTLEEMIQTAISKKMSTFCLTEHMPRHDQDRYPEEVDSGATMEDAFANQAAHVKESLRMQQKYRSEIELPLGFETDYCRPEAGGLVRRLLSAHAFDFFIGSVHHVKAIPIDYSTEMYVQARSKCGGTEEGIFTVYFEEQYAMLNDLKPLVVGHFDLIRLKSDDCNVDFKSMPAVWSLMMRNLNFIASYGGVLEINTAALRKGMNEPYPGLAICKEFVRRGGRFCLSDDSHGIEQVAYGYSELLPFLKEAQISELCYLQHSESPNKIVDRRFPKTEIRTMSLEAAQQHQFWLAAGHT